VSAEERLAVRRAIDTVTRQRLGIDERGHTLAGAYRRHCSGCGCWFGAAATEGCEHCARRLRDRERRQRYAKKSWHVECRLDDLRAPEEHRDDAIAGRTTVEDALIPSVREAAGGTPTR
jgi:hypothetical protein